MSMDSAFERDLYPATAPEAALAAPIRAGAALNIAFVIGAVVFVFAFAMRMAELDSLPMTTGETKQALASFRAVMPGASQADTYESDSVIVFLAQGLSFSLLGGSEMTARLLTAVAGAVLTVMPLLFAAQLGRGRAVMLSLILAFSPVALIASRESEPAIWAAVFALIFLRALAAWNRARIACEPASGRAAITALAGAALIALCGASGLVAMLIILVPLALASGRRQQATDDDGISLSEGENHIPLALEAARAFPWSAVLPGVLVAVFGAATGFLLYPAGLSTIGQGFATLAGWIGLGARPLVVSVFYEPHLWALGIIALFIALRGHASLADRFLAYAAVAAAMSAVIFGQAGSANALWLTLPLAGLAATTLAACFNADDSSIFAPPPTWARWIVALGFIGALAVFTIALHGAARALVTAQDGLLSNLSIPGPSIVLLVVSTMFLVIGFFLFGSLWGTRTTWQGIGLGVAIFFSISSLGSGWSVVANQADIPVQAWRAQASNIDVVMLRHELLRVAERQTRGFLDLPVVALAPEDGVIAWVLRDFSEAQFIDDPREAINREVVILPETLAQPELGTAYVGQAMTMTTSWDAAAYAIDLPALWTQRLARTPVTSSDRVVLWLRQDIYNGTAVISD